MPDYFQCASSDQLVQRTVDGLVLWGAGECLKIYEVAMPEPYSDRYARWGTSVEDALPLSLALLANCAITPGASDYMDRAKAWEVHQQFAEEFLCPLNPAVPLKLDWYDVQSWLDRKILGEPGSITGLILRIREFDRLLHGALDIEDTSRRRYVAPETWARWNIEAIVSICLLEGRIDSQALRRFADHLLDVKFKLYCLLEIDLPAYSAAIDTWGFNPDNIESTSQGFATRLSQEVTLILKSRAVWESIMNAVYRYVAGKSIPTVSATDESGARFKSKSRKFFTWVSTQPQWASLATFAPLVERLDGLRTPEVHEFSRVRGDFTKLVLQPIDQCVELLNRILTYVFDHFVAAIAMGSTVSYDATSKGAMTLS